MIVANRNHRAEVESYIEQVLDGTRVAGLLERSMVERHLADLERAGDDDFPYVFSWTDAERACKFFPLLKHTDGEYAGKPFELYPWQKFIVASLFGWRNQETGHRRFREAFISVGRGNGKTPFGAALLLLLFGFDSPLEERAEVYTFAVKRDQAALAFKAAKRFVERSGLSDTGYVQVYKDRLTIDRFSSELLPLSSDAKSLDGLNIHGVLKDELHAWSDYYRDAQEKLQTAMGKRRQPLEITITTAGDETSTLWKEQHELCRKVLDRSSDFDVPSLFAAVFEIDDDDDELDERVWAKANPMLEYGVVKIDYLRTEAAKALADPGARPKFKRYHANKRTTSSVKSFPAELWAKGSQAIPWDDIKNVYAGVDLGWCDDLAAIGYCCPIGWTDVEGKSKRRWAIWSDVFVPRGSRRRLDRPPFAEWIRNKQLVVTDSEWTDTAAMYRALERRRDEFGIKSLAYDSNNAQEFAGNCVNELRLDVYAFRQSHAKYHEPLKEFTIALNEGRIHHAGDSLLGWTANNVVTIENNEGHRMPSKRRSEEKIDPFIAVLMAFGEALFGERSKKSVYETRGPLML